MPRVALYAGSFDPVTNGHVDVIRQAARLADRLVIAVGIHPGKAPLFPFEDRIAMLADVCAPIAKASGCEMSTVTFEDLVVALARREGATVLIRGLRPWAARSPPHWSGRSPPWGAILAPSCRRTSRPASRPSSPSPSRGKPGADMRSLFVALVALVCATAASAQSLPAGLDPQNAIFLDTAHGRVVIKLRADLAPKHAARTKTLAREKFYDNVPFHRVIPGFMAQTGDGQRGDGTGGSKYPNLPAEFSNVPFKRGIVGMARATSPNSANSQFFIMFDEAPSLNGQYTVIGEVVSGMAAVDKIKKGSEANNGTVTNPDRIVHIKLAAAAMG